MPSTICHDINYEAMDCSVKYTCLS